MHNAMACKGLHRFPPPRPEWGRGSRRGKPQGGISAARTVILPESTYTNFRRDLLLRGRVHGFHGFPPGPLSLREGLALALPLVIVVIGLILGRNPAWEAFRARTGRGRSRSAASGILSRIMRAAAFQEGALRGRIRLAAVVALTLRGRKLSEETRDFP